MHRCLMAFCPPAAVATAFDHLLNRPVLRMLRRFHPALTTVFAHYATSERPFLSFFVNGPRCSLSPAFFQKNTPLYLYASIRHQ